MAYMSCMKRVLGAPDLEALTVEKYGFQQEPSRVLPIETYLSCMKRVLGTAALEAITVEKWDVVLVASFVLLLCMSDAPS